MERVKRNWLLGAVAIAVVALSLAVAWWWFTADPKAELLAYVRADAAGKGELLEIGEPLLIDLKGQRRWAAWYRIAENPRPMKSSPPVKEGEIERGIVVQRGRRVVTFWVLKNNGPGYTTRSDDWELAPAIAAAYELAR